MIRLFELIYSAKRFTPIDFWQVFEGNIIVRSFFPDVFLGSHTFIGLYYYIHTYTYIYTYIRIYIYTLYIYIYIYYLSAWADQRKNRTIW